MTMNHDHGGGGFFKSRSNLALIVFLAIAGFFLVAEHRAHVFEWLPFILLAACPLMHLFHGHGGEGGQGPQEDGRPKKDEDRKP